jgi:hypothetical protein
MGANSKVLGVAYVKGGGEESLLIHCQLKIPPPWLLIHLEFILLVLAQYVVCSLIAIILC